MRLWWMPLLVASVAHADDKPVNLLVSVPTVIAVSSTVDNAAIKPEHIADGKLDTAWNSRTNELTPSVMIRVAPTSARVTSIKLTAGFTKIDKRLGDLFTMNPRIKKVRVLAGTTWKDFTLDINNRGLQELQLDIPPGDIQLTVLESEPGTKKAWREISISELEVWGVPLVPVKKQKPSLRLRSLDALPVLTKAECRKALGTLEGAITLTEEIGVTPELTVCRADTRSRKLGERVHFVAAGRLTKAALGTRVDIAIQNGSSIDPDMNDNETTTDEYVALDLAPLRTTEQALTVVETRRSNSNYHGTTWTKTTWYRVTKDGLVELLAWDGILDDQMESNDATKCDPPTFKVTAAMPKKIVIPCTDYKSDWHNDDLSKRGMHETPANKVFVWNGTDYDER